MAPSAAPTETLRKTQLPVHASRRAHVTQRAGLRSRSRGRIAKRTSPRLKAALAVASEMSLRWPTASSTWA